MYSRIEPLFYSTPHELKDPIRIRKLCRERRSVPLYVPAGFILGGLGSFAFAILIMVGAAKYEPVKATIGALCCVALGIACFWTMTLFWKSRKIDPLRGYLANPLDYEFHEAKITKAIYQPGDRKLLDRIMVEGHAKLSDGTPLLFFEFFVPSAWPYVDEEMEKNLKPGDDWYDKKGQRPKLPVSAIVIYKKSQPSHCALAGISKV
jgi:hypothetical protein